MDGKTKNTGLVITLVIFIIISLGLACFIVYDKILSSSSKSNVSSKNSSNNVEENLSNEGSEKNQDTPVVDVNKRLYSVNSDLQQQRYYLLLDDATYDTNQNFLTKKTYILDMNMIAGNKIVKEIDLSSVFKSYVDNYINEHKGNNSGTCTVEYFSATNGLTPPPIDYDKEVAFKGYYRCLNGNAETSLGSEIYAYNVESNSIRVLGSSN